MLQSARLNRITFYAVLVVTVFAAEARAQNAKRFWTDFIKGCALNETIGRDLLYVGPTNNIGTAAVWRKSNRGYHTVRVFDDAVVPEDVRKVVIRLGNDVTCAGNRKSGKKLNPSLILQSLLVPITGKFSLDMAKAQTIAVSADSYSWDQILEGPFRDNFGKYSTAYRKETVAPAHTLAGRALRLNNLVAELTFDKKTSTDLSAAYKPGANQEIGAGFKGEWTKTGNLVLKAPGTNYLVVELWDYDEGGFQSGGKTTHFRKRTLEPTAKVVSGEPASK